MTPPDDTRVYFNVIVITLGVLVLASLRLRANTTKEAFVEGDGEVLPALMSSMGQKIMLSAQQQRKPCIIKGVLMPPSFNAASAQVLAARPGASPSTDDVCEINAELPQMESSCREPTSTLYDSYAVSNVTLVPTSGVTGGSKLKCRVEFTPQATVQQLDAYSKRNDADYEKRMLEADKRRLEGTVVAKDTRIRELEQESADKARRYEQESADKARRYEQESADKAQRYEQEQRRSQNDWSAQRRDLEAQLAAALARAQAPPPPPPPPPPPTAQTLTSPATFSNKLQDNAVFRVSGVERTCMLNFRTTALGPIIAYHWNPREREGVVVQNTLYNGAWGAEERVPMNAVGMAPGRPFTFYFVVRAHSFEWQSSDRATLYSYRNRINMFQLFSVDFYGVKVERMMMS